MASIQRGRPPTEVLWAGRIPARMLGAGGDDPDCVRPRWCSAAVSTIDGPGLASDVALGTRHLKPGCGCQTSACSSANTCATSSESPSARRYRYQSDRTIERTRATSRGSAGS